MKKVFVTVLALAMAMCVAGCGKEGEVQVPVQSVAEIAGLGALGMAQRFSGVVSVDDPVKVMKNSDAKIGEMMVEEGDDVKEGDVLFVYDTDQLNLDLEKARLELEKLWNDIANMQKEREDLENQKAKAPSDQQLQYSLEINSKDTEILEGNFNAQVKQKEIESLERSLENATVKATASGRIGEITDGEKTDNMGNIKPVITIVQTNDLLIKGSINETNMYALAPGMDLTIRSRVDERTWRGTLLRIDTDNPIQNQDNYYMMDMGGDGTGTSSKYPFYVELEDTEGLMLGQHVYVEPGSGEEEADTTWRLPAWYIADIESDPYVWAEGRNGKLEKRHITLDLSDGSGTDMDAYVITDGISLEDKIAFPDETLQEGASCVDYREYVPPAEDGAGGGEMPVIEGEDFMQDEMVPDMNGFADDMPQEDIGFEEMMPEFPEDMTGGDGE